MPDYAGHFARVTPVGRVGYPEDIAGAVNYFCSDAASYVTGQVFWLMAVCCLAGDVTATPRKRIPKTLETSATIPGVSAIIVA